MNAEHARLIEAIQQRIVTLIATHPAGHQLCLIGGYRLRLLDQSQRLSMDIDYHWDGDLAEKQAEIHALLTRRLLPEIPTRWGYEGQLRLATGPEADSPFVKTVEVVCFRVRPSPDRIVIPVEVTSIPCADPPIVRTRSGTVFLTASDADMVESKVLALFCRAFMQARDLVDLFLYADRLTEAASERLRVKFERLGLGPEVRQRQAAQWRANRAVHVRAIDAVIHDQVEPDTAAQLRTAGGGALIFDAVMQVLTDRLQVVSGGGP